MVTEEMQFVGCGEIQTGSETHAMITGAFSAEIKRLGREANNSPPPTTDFKNKWS
jgi:hypothetical protein